MAAGAAGSTLVVALGAIRRRGYLVPGTPALTKRHLPDPVLRWFGKPRNPPVPAGDDPRAVLRRVGVLDRSGDGEYRPSAGFADDWTARIAATDPDDPLDALLERVGVRADRTAVERPAGDDGRIRLDGDVS